MADERVYWMKQKKINNNLRYSCIALYVTFTMPTHIKQQQQHQLHQQQHQQHQPQQQQQHQQQQQQQHVGPWKSSLWLSGSPRKIREQKQKNSNNINNSNNNNNSNNINNRKTLYSSKYLGTFIQVHLYHRHCIGRMEGLHGLIISYIRCSTHTVM